MGAVMGVKSGKTPKSKVSDKVEKAAETMSKPQIKDFLKKPKSVKKESTTSASSGSFQTPMNTNIIKKNNPINMQEISLTIKEIERMVKQTLLYEEYHINEAKSTEVFSQKAKQTHSNSMGKKVGKPADNGAKAHVTQTGKDNKKANKESENKANSLTKSNIKNSSTPNVNKNKLQNEDQRIEAQQGGMQDLEYDNITPEDKKRFKKYATDQKDNSGEKSKINQQIIDDAKKRNKSDDKSVSSMPRFQSGANIFLLPNNKRKDKNIAFENKSIKRFTFKESFDNDKQMISKIPMKAKNHLNIFEMCDGEATYKLKWEGDNKSGCPIILESSNTKQTQKIMEQFTKTVNYKTDKFKGSDVDEHSMLKSILDGARKLEDNQ